MSLAIQHLYQHLVLEDHRLYEALSAIVREINSGSINTGSGITSIVTFIMTTNPYNAPVIPVSEGGNLVLIPIQDGTGGRVLAYDATYYKDGPTAVHPAVNTRSVIGFVGNQGKWQWDGRFLTGLPL